MNVVAAGKRVGLSVVNSVVDNAVITKEFRTRMRGWKPYVVMAGYVLLLVVVMAIAFWQVAEEAFRHGYYSPVNDSNIGIVLFATLSITQVILLSLVLPSLTASSVTQEIERRTIDMLALSKLTPARIVVGKHMSGFFYALMLLVCSVPLAGLCLMFGGISPAEVAVTYAGMIAWAFMFTSIGVMCSTLVTKTAAATLSSYGICIGYIFTTLPWGFANFAYGMSSTADRFVFGALNPAFLPFTALGYGQVAGAHLPLALVSSVFQLLVGVIMLLVASTHVRYQRAERALPIRLLIMALSGGIIWCSIGSMRYFGSTSAAATAGWLLVASISILMTLGLAPIAFATGKILKPKEGSIFAYALSPRRIFRSDIGGAIPFMALWTVFCHIVTGQAFFWTATAGHYMIKPGFWNQYWKTGAVMLAVVIGMSALGILFSTLTPKRRNAAAFSLVAFVVLFTGYMFMSIGINPENEGAMIWQLAALWPMTPLLVLSGDWSYGVTGMGSPDLGYEHIAWVVTSGVYLLIAAGALALAGKRHARGYGVQEEE